MAPLPRPDPDLARVVLAWPDLPPPLKAAVLALLAAAVPPADDFAAAFDRAFDRLDADTGGRNFLSLVALRPALAVDRATFDAGLDELRRRGRYTLSGAEGRHGLGDAERAASLREEGQLLLYVARREP